MADTEVTAPECSYSPSVMMVSAPDRIATVLAPPSSRLRALARHVWLALAAAWAVFTGLLPHVLHHAGPLAGAALFAGFGGSLLFFAIGLVAAIPFLRRLHRRFGGWRVPGIALGLFVAVFSFSTFVIGPKISREDSSTSTAPTESPAAPGAQSPSVDEHGH